MYFRICPDCGANNDPGERCDCRDEKEAAPLQRERPQAKHDIASLTGFSASVKERGTDD